MKTLGNCSLCLQLGVTYLSALSDVLVSDRQRYIVAVVNNVLLLGLLSLFGMISNIINMIVFARQGLSSTINMSFFAMAVSDFLCLVFQEWHSVCSNPWLEELQLPVVYQDIMYLTAGVPREFFSRITCLITVYITAERCLCVAFPLHVKQMITIRRTKITIISIYLSTWLSGVPFFCTSYVDWKFYRDVNRTLLALVVTNQTLESVLFISHALFGFLTFLSVVVLTCILVWKLYEKRAWRQKATVQPGNTESMSSKDRKTITMVVLIATVLIVCYTPAMLLCVVTFCEPEFNFSGRYFNMFITLWSVALLFETVNSSVNIFLYLKMSTKYRQTFTQLWGTVPVTMH